MYPSEVTRSRNIKKQLEARAERRTKPEKLEKMKRLQQTARIHAFFNIWETGISLIFKTTGFYGAGI